MVNLKNIDEVKSLQSNLHSSFDTPQGQEVMKFIEQAGSWYPTIFDTNETNDIVARDANRRLIGTIKTLLMLKPEQIVALTRKEE